MYLTLQRCRLLTLQSRLRRSFLLESLRATSNETIQHGACLGLGLAGLGTCDEELFEDLKGVLYTDSAVRPHHRLARSESGFGSRLGFGSG